MSALSIPGIRDLSLSQATQPCTIKTSNKKLTSGPTFSADRPPQQLSQSGYTHTTYGCVVQAYSAAGVGHTVPAHESIDLQWFEITPGGPRCVTSGTTTTATATITTIGGTITTPITTTTTTTTAVGATQTHWGTHWVISASRAMLMGSYFWSMRRTRLCWPDRLRGSIHLQVFQRLVSQSL